MSDCNAPQRSLYSQCESVLVQRTNRLEFRLVFSGRQPLAG